MGNIIEIWVISSGGVCLYNYTVEDKMEPSMFGGFMSAISTFGQQYSSRPVHSLNIGDYLIVFEKSIDYNLLFIGRSAPNIKDRKLRKNVQELMHAFIEKFPKNLLKNWTGGDITEFRAFDEVAAPFFVDKTEKTKGMW